MLLLFDEDHKIHLSFLKEIDLDVVKEFFHIAVDFLKQGANSKVYQTASQKLGVAADVVQHAVEGLMFLLSESTKLKVAPVDFHDSIMTLGFSEELRSELLQLYENNCSEIRTILFDLSMDLCCYHNLEWRLDIHLGSRSLRHQISPTVLMKLSLNESTGKTSTKLLQADPVNLVHLMTSLDTALKEIKSSHCRRITRHIR